MSDELDLSHLPSGQLGWRQLVEQLGAIPDKTERHFLEFKGSETVLSAKEDQAKVAKFVLGAANRDPARAADRFDGNAIMLIGIDNDELVGVPLFEPMDLHNYVTKFIGNPGPVWDFQLVSVSDKRSVVIIVVAPPVAAMQPWVCRADGPGNLEDGLTLFRADGTTRRAKSAEIDAMHERARVAAKPQIDLLIEIVGVVRAYDYDSDVTERYIEGRRAALIDALPKPTPPKPPTPLAVTGSATFSPDANLSAMLAGIAASQGSVFKGPNAFGAVDPEDRTKDEYLAEIDSWEAEFRRELPKLLDEAARCVWPGVVVKVTNATDTYLDEPEVHVHIEGPVEGLSWRSRDELPVPADFLPKPPRRWGPRARLSSLLAGTYGVERYGVPRFPGINRAMLET